MGSNKSLLGDSYLEHRHVRPKRHSTSMAEREVVKTILACEDDSEMVARLGCLMVDNEVLDESESKNQWLAFGLAVMLELDNRKRKGVSAVEFSIVAPIPKVTHSNKTPRQQSTIVVRQSSIRFSSR